MDNLESNKLQIATKTRLGSVSVKNTATINNNTNIKKVLTSCAKVIVEDVTPLSGEVKFSGVVEYNLLVVLEDNEIMSLTQKSNFSTNFENSSITPESTISICSSLQECSNVSNTAGEITYLSIINFEIIQVNVDNNLSCATLPEDIFIKENEISYNYLLGKQNYNFVVNFDIEHDSKINKILYVTNNAYIKNVIPSGNYFVVGGEVVSFIVYQDEEGTIKSLTKQNAFSEEIEFSGLEKETNIQVLLQTKETIIVENAEKNVFSVEVPITLMAQFFNKKALNCVVDAYSLTNQVNLTTNSYVKSNYFSTLFFEENILTTFNLNESMQPIDKILAVTPINTQVLNQIVKNGEVLLEGLATINVIYYFEDEDSTNILNSIDVDIPFSINVSVPEIEENNFANGAIVIGDVSIKNKRGKELEILADAKINLNFTKEETCAVTTQIVVGEEKPPKDYALEIYIAKQNQTLWDVAKELNISSQELINQNPNLTLPIKAGDKIVAYNSRQANFDD